MQVVWEHSHATCCYDRYPQCEDGVEASRIDRGHQRWLREQRTQGRRQCRRGLDEAFPRIDKDVVTHLLVCTRNRLGRTADGAELPHDPHKRS